MAATEKQKQNLEPAKPGEVRNPKGKPKGTKNSATIIAKWLKAKEATVDPITKKQVKLSQLDIIVLQQLTKARKGDTTAFNALLDRMEGKPKQVSELTAPDGGPLQLESKHTVIFKDMDGK